MGKVSIVIPVYNMEAHLRECLDSVLGQSHHDLEAVCVDDGSTDGSPRILAEYAAADERIRIVTQQNAGSGPARNAGIRTAVGKYLMFLDPDDYYSDSTVVQAMHDAIRNSSCSIAAGRHRRVLPDGTPAPLPKGVSPLPWPPAGKMRYRDYQAPWGYAYCIYEMSLIKGKGIVFPSFRRLQDPLFFVRAMTAAEEFLMTDIMVYCYRISHKKVDFKADGGRLQKEREAGYQATLEEAKRQGYEYLIDCFERRRGTRRPDLYGRIAENLCGVGHAVRLVPTEREIDGFFAFFKEGRPFDESLFGLIQRCLTAPRALRKEPQNALCRGLLEVFRAGRLRISDWGRSRRMLLRWLLIRARFMRSGRHG